MLAPFSIEGASSKPGAVQTACALTCGLLGSALAADPKATIADLNARLAKIGPAKVEGTVKVGDKTAPALFLGTRRISNNFDLVDGIRKDHGATATIFVKDGDEFVRVSTNVLTPEGKRGVGTALAHNKAFDALAKGDGFCGPIEVLGTNYDACYSPLKDGSGKVVGATYVGHKK